jgi:hypothetical protein
LVLTDNNLNIRNHNNIKIIVSKELKLRKKLRK